MDDEAKYKAWARALTELAKTHGLTNSHYMKEAVYQARLGYAGTALLLAVDAGLPSDHVNALYTLIFD